MSQLHQQFKKLVDLYTTASELQITMARNEVPVNNEALETANANFIVGMHDARMFLMGYPTDLAYNALTNIVVAHQAWDDSLLEISVAEEGDDGEVRIKELTDRSDELCNRLEEVIQEGKWQSLENAPLRALA